MDSEFFLDAVEVGLLELEIWPSEAFEAAVGLEEVGFELRTEIYHVGAEGVKGVLFIAGDFVEYFFGFGPNLAENQCLFS